MASQLGEDMNEELQNENGFLEAENALLQARVNELADEVNDLVEALDASFDLIEAIANNLTSLSDERRYLYQVLAAIQAYGGENILVVQLLAEAALSEIITIDYGTDDEPEV
jgi:uncharacterized protein YoxC